MLEPELLREFLGSFKNAESVTPDVRAAISVPSGMEQAVADAARAGRTVFVTGSAGSGKTHLLNELPTRLGATLPVVPFAENPPKRKYILVVPDATVLSLTERLELLTRPSPHRSATVIAINEGPLRETGKEGPSAYADAVRLLHRGQQGLSDAFDPAKPTVVDIGGFDPIEDGVIARLVELSSLNDVVTASTCDCQPGDCPRRKAWRQLSSPAIRERLAEVVRLAKAVDDSWLFRDLWDFVADIAIGGDCRGQVPTSPWFWQTFYGQSRLSRAIRGAADPEAIPIPSAEPRIWYASWESPQLALLDNAELLPLSRPDLEPSRFLFVKAQLLTAGKEGGAGVFLRHRNPVERALSGEQLRAGTLLSAINRYMTYGYADAAATALNLWADYSVERRTERSRTQVLLGSEPVERFDVRSALSILNHPDPGLRKAGKGRFLVHRDSEAAWRVDREKLSLMEEGRSFLHSNRPHTDLEWDLLRFFSAIHGRITSNPVIGVLATDFKKMTSELFRYRAIVDPPTIEVAQ